MASKEDPVTNLGAVGGGNALAVEAAVPDVKKMEKEAVLGGKRKAQESSEAEVGGEGATAADATVVPAVGEVFVDEATGIKWVDMPESYLCWVLSQKRTTPSPYDPRECTMMSPEEIERELASMERLKASLAGVEERFFEFQAWVRKMYQTNGRVLVPVDSIPDAFTSAE